MKLLHSIFIIFALATEGLALECYSCSSSDGNCDDQKTCTVVGDEKCITRTVFSTESDAVPVQHYRGCSACSQSTSYKNGTNMVVEDCCSDMLCNGQNPRALHQRSDLICYSFLSATNSIVLTEKTCTAGQQCMFFILESGQNTKILSDKGCASETECKAIDQTYPNLSGCCKLNLCNNKIIIPGNKGTSITGGGIFLSLLAVLMGKVFY